MPVLMRRQRLFESCPFLPVLEKHLLRPRRTPCAALAALGQVGPGIGTFGVLRARASIPERLENPLSTCYLLAL